MLCRAHFSCRSTCRLRRDPARTCPDVSRASSQKNLREKARREKAAAKRERREATAAEAAASAPVEPSAGDQPKVLAELAELHEQYEADQIDFDEFESRKQALLGQLHV